MLTRIGPVRRGEEPYLANLGVDDRTWSPARIHCRGDKEGKRMDEGG